MLGRAAAERAGRLPTVLGGLVVALLLAGALGAAGVGTGSGPSAPEGAPPAAPATGPAPAPDASAIVWKPEDFPPGWAPGPEHPGPRPPGDAGIGTDAVRRACPGLPPDPTRGRVTSEAETFFSTEVSGFFFAGSFVAVLGTPAVAADGFGLLASPPFLSCALDAFAQGFAEEAEGGFTLSPAAEEPLVVEVPAEQSSSRRARYRAQQEGSDLPLFVDVVVLRSGRAVAVAILGGVFEPVPADIAGPLLATLAGRMAPTA